MINQVKASENYFSTIPDPIDDMNMPIDLTYYLTVNVNGKKSPELYPIEITPQGYFVGDDFFKKLAIHFPKKLTKKINLKKIKEIETHYNPDEQTLNITVPAQWLPQQYLSGLVKNNYTAAKFDDGFLFNYNFYGERASTGQIYSSLFSESQLYSHIGEFYFSGTWMPPIDKQTRNQYGQLGHFVRYDTQWRYDDLDHAIRYELGDFTSNNLSWTDSIRMAGLHIYRDYSIRPDITTYPLFSVAGSAKVPSTVDLFIDGIKSSSQHISAGPFVIDNIPFINGDGTATIVTSDANGNQVKTQIPFYSSMQLLRKGLNTYDFALGVMRYNYGYQSANYKDTVLSGNVRYGLSNHLTLSSHSEIAKNLLLLGGGIDFSALHLGLISLSSELSKNKNLGARYNFTWNYQNKMGSISLSHQQSSKYFSDLTQYDAPISETKRSDSLMLSTSLTNGLSIGVGYFDMQDFSQQRSQVANLSLSYPLLKQNVITSLSFSKDFSNHDTSAMLTLTIPLFGQSNAQFNLNNNDSHIASNISFNSPANIDHRLGWDVDYSKSGNQLGYYNISLDYLNPYGEISTGVYGDKQANSWLNMSGSFAYMDHYLFPTENINSSFIIVDTNGVANVPYYYQGMNYGVTNRDGIGLIPNVTPYSTQKVSIKTDTLAQDVVVKSPIVEVNVQSGKGVIAHFDMQKSQYGITYLLDNNHRPLPLGAVLINQDTKQSSVVGYDGMVYLQPLSQHNHLAISLGQNKRCYVTINKDAFNGYTHQAKPQICRSKMGK